MNTETSRNIKTRCRFENQEQQSSSCSRRVQVGQMTGYFKSCQLAISIKAISGVVVALRYESSAIMRIDQFDRFAKDDAIKCVQETKLLLRLQKLPSSFCILPPLQS